DLQVGQGALLVRVPTRRSSDLVEALGQALGVVQPVHADRQRPGLRAGAQAAYRRLVDRARRLARDFRGIDADRERAGAEAASTRRLEQARADDAAAAVQAYVGMEAVVVALGLEAEQVVGVQRREQALVVGHGHHQVCR